MTQAYDAPIGAPCWIDLMTSDPAASTAFYSALFGWNAEEPDPQFGGYFNFQREGLRIAGCMKNGPEMGGMPDMWSVYLKTDDIEGVVKAVAANGGQVYAPAMQVGDLGSMAVFGDPAGTGIGAWQPSGGPNSHEGFGAYDVPNAPGWFELQTRDFGTSVKFYETVFGWDTHVVSDSDEFRYTTLGAGDDQKAGIMDASSFVPEGAPAPWSIYFRCADVDATLAKVVELGGTITHPAEDTPYGRVAAAVDPTGAVLKLVG